MGDPAKGAPQVLSSAEIYDPQSGTFTAAPNMAEARYRLPAAITMVDGRVLIVGGGATVEIFDGSPRRLGFETAEGKLDGVRYYPAVIQLMDGSMRIFGGFDSKGVSTAKTWSYRP